VTENSKQIPCRRFEKPAPRGTRMPTNGQGDAFESIYRSYSSRVYRWCLRMSKDWAEAEDLTQEAFLQLFRKLGTFRGESAFSTWLYRLVVNVALMRFRKKSHVDASLAEERESEEESLNLGEILGAPDTHLARAIERLNLEVAIDQLPPGFRQVFMLHDVEGYEHNEIAAILGVSEGTSKSQLHKARLRLRALLRSTENARPNTVTGRIPPASRRKRCRRGRPAEAVNHTLVPACESHGNVSAAGDSRLNPKQLDMQDVKPSRSRIIT